MSHPNYPDVFKPIQIGKIALRNRIFVPAHTTNYGEDNLPSPRHAAYHRERAAGGAALIIFEGIRVHRSSLGRKQGVNGYDAACIPAFREVADAVHEQGARLFGQILHLGRHIDGNYTRTPSWGASPIPWTASAPAPHPMTTDEIDLVVRAHAHTAQNLVEAGLDGIELQMAHGHLLQQFMSPLANQRNDQYGGSLANRLRFAQETLVAVRHAVGPDVCLGLRISAEEYVDGGLTLNDMCEMLPMLLACGPVDFVNISHSAYHGSYTISTQMADMAFEKKTFQPLTVRLNQVIQEQTSPPVVMTVCQYRELSEAQSIISDGHTDMVGMARAHIADPALVNKAQEQREADTIPCVACNQGCAGMLAQSLAITCLSNPRAGLEREWPTLKSVAGANEKRVMIIGGGPAGCEAAGSLAASGICVTLFERESRLGGQLNWTRQMPLRADFIRLLDSHQHKTSRDNINVQLERTAGVSDILAVAPDAIIVATGAMAAGATFERGGTGFTMQQALADPDALGDSIVIVDLTGSWAQASVTEYLADLGKTVTVIAPGGAPAWGVNIYSSFAMRRRWQEKQIRIIANHVITGFDGNVATLTDLSLNRTETKLNASAVIAADHGHSDDQLLNALLTWKKSEQSNIPILAAGDCQAPRSALEAIFEGQEAARRIIAALTK